MRLNVENPVGEGFEQWLPDSEVRPVFDGTDVSCEDRWGLK